MSERKPLGPPAREGGRDPGAEGDPGAPRRARGTMVGDLDRIVQRSKGHRWRARGPAQAGGAVRAAGALGAPHASADERVHRQRPRARRQGVDRWRRDGRPPGRGGRGSDAPAGDRRPDRLRTAGRPGRAALYGPDAARGSPSRRSPSTAPRTPPSSRRRSSPSPTPVCASGWRPNARVVPRAILAEPVVTE